MSCDSSGGWRAGSYSANSGASATAIGPDPFAHFPRQVQAREIGIALLEALDDPQRLAVVVEPAVILHELGQDVLAEVAERGVAEVVGERQGLDEVFVQAERARDGPPDLAHLDRVRQARAVVIPLVIDEDLRLVFEPAEGSRMDDAVAIPLVERAVAVMVFRVTAAAGEGARLRVRCERALDALHGRSNRHAGRVMVGTEGVNVRCRSRRAALLTLNC